MVIELVSAQVAFGAAGCPEKMRSHLRLEKIGVAAALIDVIDPVKMVLASWRVQKKIKKLKSMEISIYQYGKFPGIAKHVLGC